MENLDRLAIHTMTTKPWDLPTAVEKYSRAGVRGVGLWRQWLEGRSLAESRALLDGHGMKAVSLVRSGFFPGLTPEERQTALDDNRRALMKPPPWALRRSFSSVVRNRNSVLRKTAAKSQMALPPVWNTRHQSA